MEEIKNQPKESRFDPYVFHGGSTVCLHGKDYSIIAGDTRLSNGGYGIQTRYSTKICKLTNKCVLSTVGCQSDCYALHKILKMRLKWYKHQHKKEMSTIAISQMLMNLLYSRRFFPYFSFCMLGGLDEDGNGISFGYDAIGSKGESGADGTGRELIQPLLDNQLLFKNQKLIPKDFKEKGISLKNALALVKDAFQSAGERDIYTGDFVEICIVTKKGIVTQKMELKKD